MPNPFLSGLMHSVPDIPFQRAMRANRGCARCTGLDRESQLVLINEQPAEWRSLTGREEESCCYREANRSIDFPEDLLLKSREGTENKRVEVVRQRDIGCSETTQYRSSRAAQHQAIYYTLGHHSSTAIVYYNHR